MAWLQWSLVAAGIFVLDRLLRAAEDRGWVYYRKRKPSITTMAAALFQLETIVRPQQQHVVEQQRQIREDEDEDGGEGPKRHTRDRVP